MVPAPAADLLEVAFSELLHLPVSGRLQQQCGHSTQPHPKRAAYGWEPRSSAQVETLSQGAVHGQRLSRCPGPLPWGASCCPRRALQLCYLLCEQKLRA